MSEKDYDYDLFSSSSKNQDSTTNSEVDPWSLEALNLKEEQEDVRDIYSSTETDKKSQKKQPPKKDVKLTSVKKKKSRKSLSSIGRIALSVFLVCVIAGTVIIGAMGVYIFGFMDPNIDYNLNNLKLQYTSIVYAQDPETNEYYELSSFHGEQNRIWVDYVDMAPNLADAIVSIEDKRFWDHEGVDWKRTIGAVFNELTNFWGNTQGGSTITQQLVKNLTRDDDMSYMRKVREIVRASQLEKEYHKSVILECYINTVHFGNGCDGIETAAKFYFGKESKDLTLLECASLAATIRTPGVENPLDGPETNKERRELCLSLMLEDKAITQEEYDAAMKDTLTVIGKDPTEEEGEKNSQVYSWFEEALLDQIQKDLVEQRDYTEEEASNAIFSGGLRIYSTYNRTAQEALDATFADDSYFVKDREGEYPQAAQVIMDYQGHVVAMSGGRGEKTVNRGLNRATDSTRQPGSSIKPLSVYSSGIEFNKLTYSSHILDYHIKLANGGYYPPAAGSNQYVTTQRAIQNSLNSTAVRVANELSPEKCFEFLRERYHLSTIVEERDIDGVMYTDKTLSAMALGGMVDGVSVLEMTAAYATFGNLGVYWKPTTYTVVYDTFGNKILEQETRGEQVISPETANVMCELLQTVTVSGTAAAARFGSWPLMGKTGTTDDKHDCWLAGGSPYYVSAIWMGYDSGKDLPSGANPTNRVWRPTMQKIHSDLDLCDFNVSSGVSYRKYCTESGGLATSNCTSTAWGYYKDSYLPTCSVHGGAILDKATYPSPVGGKYVKQLPIVLPEADAAQISIDKQREAADKEKEG